MSNIIWDDLEFFLTRLRNLPVSKSLTLDEKNGGFCVSTGCSFESWVYYPERINNPETVKRAVEFFRQENISFMWPVYNGGEKILEDCGLLYAGNLTAMSFDSKASHSHNNDLNIYEAEVNYWADVSWRGFGGEAGTTTENYYKLVEAFKNDENLRLFIADYENEHAGILLITNEKNLTGVYYFATVPEFRRKGVARAMMNKICELADGKTITLQATPAGLPFYKSFGFEERFIIPIYSTESDIF